MSSWTAKTEAGRVYWAEGEWLTVPSALKTELIGSLAGPCQAIPLCPVFDPDEDLERALLAVLIAEHGETVVFDGDPPLDDVVPPVPDGAVS